MRRKNITIIIILLSGLTAYSAYAFNLPKWFPFNKENALSEWQEKIFKDKVIYSVELKNKDGHLAAKSDEACSGLLYRIKFDVNKFPLMSWNWKVVKFPEKSNEPPVKGGWIERDDYAARVYVVFPSWNFMRTESIEYIWDEYLEEGTVMTSPYFKNIKLIVAESGAGNLNEWVFEKRNLAEDYKKAFGRDPNRLVGAVALMTDADNTSSSAEAFYKDLKVGYTDE